MTIILEPGAAVPAYRQIADQIRHYLVGGGLKAGDKLPSVRRLAIDLAIHHNTVAEAYRTLAAENWLEISHGKSVTVLSRVPGVRKLRETRKEQEGFARRLRNLVAEMRSRGLSEDWIAGALVELSGRSAE